MLSSLSVAGTDQREMSKTSQQSTACQQESLDTSSTNLLETSTGVKPVCWVQNKILSHKAKPTAIKAGGKGKASVFWSAPFLSSSFLASLSSLYQDWEPSSALVPGTLEVCHPSAASPELPLPSQSGSVTLKFNPFLGEVLLITVRSVFRSKTS